MVCLGRRAMSDLFSWSEASERVRTSKAEKAAAEPPSAPAVPPPSAEPVMFWSTIISPRGRTLRYQTSPATWLSLVWHHYQNAEREGVHREFQDANVDEFDRVCLAHPSIRKALGPKVPRL